GGSAERSKRASRRSASSDGKLVQLGDKGKLLEQGTQVEVEVVQAPKVASRQSRSPTKRKAAFVKQGEEEDQEQQHGAPAGDNDNHGQNDPSQPGAATAATDGSLSAFSVGDAFANASTSSTATATSLVEIPGPGQAVAREGEGEGAPPVLVFPDLANGGMVVNGELQQQRQHLGGGGLLPNGGVLDGAAAVAAVAALGGGATKEAAQELEKLARAVPLPPKDGTAHLHLDVDLDGDAVMFNNNGN
ncbi:unnamed protein product, partial [Laminaria digitata]